MEKLGIIFIAFLVFYPSGVVANTLPGNPSYYRIDTPAKKIPDYGRIILTDDEGNTFSHVTFAKYGPILLKYKPDAGNPFIVANFNEVEIYLRWDYKQQTLTSGVKLLADGHQYEPYGFDGSEGYFIYHQKQPINIVLYNKDRYELFRLNQIPVTVTCWTEERYEYPFIQKVGKDIWNEVSYIQLEPLFSYQNEKHVKYQYCN
jgi:hypothetical protein